MKRTLTLRVTVNYPKGWTQPQIKEFLKDAVRLNTREQQNANPELSHEDDAWPLIETISPIEMRTDYAQR